MNPQSWRVALVMLGLASAAVAAQQPPAPDSADARVLSQKGMKRTLRPGDRHPYRINAQAGDYLHVELAQSGIDVMVNVQGPDGRVIGEFDSPTGPRGAEPVRFIAPAAGTYIIEARSAQPDGEPGSYAIRLGAHRPATDVDRRIAAAVAAQHDADRLRATAATRRQSLQRYDEAVDLWRAVPHPAGEASALRAKGFAHIRLSEDDHALALFQSIRVRWRAVGDHRSEAYTFLIIGTILRRQGQLKESLPTDEAALPLWRQARDREQEAFTLATLGTTHVRLGNTAQGERLHAQAISVARRARSRGLEAAMFRSLANARHQSGDSSNALVANSQALALWQRIGHRRGQAGTQVAIADILEKRGERDKAADSLARAAALWDEVGATAQAADARKRIEAMRGR